MAATKTSSLNSLSVSNLDVLSSKIDPKKESHSENKASLSLSAKSNSTLLFTPTKEEPLDPMVATQVLKGIMDTQSKILVQLAELQAAKKSELDSVVGQLPSKNVKSSTEEEKTKGSGRTSGDLMDLLKQRTGLTSAVATKAKTSSTSSSSASSSSSSFVSRNAFAEIAEEASDAERSDDEDAEREKKPKYTHEDQHPDVFRADIHADLAERMKDFRSCAALVKSFIHERNLKAQNNQEQVSANWQHQLTFLAKLIDEMVLQNGKSDPMEDRPLSMVVCRLVGIMLSLEANNDFEILEMVSNIAIDGNNVLSH